jgi:hypothetical protein
MAYSKINTFVRPSTGTAWTSVKDHGEGSDYWDWRRQYQADNGISVSFDLSSDELTLTVTETCADEATYDAFKTADLSDGRYNALRADLSAAMASAGITLAITENNDGTVQTLMEAASVSPELTG